MRYGWINGVALVVATVCGCGGSNEQAARPAASQSVAINGPISTAGAVETVNRFLDALRRGGDDGTAASLLTELARSECQRTGIVIQPIGTPNAKFEVTRGEIIPGRADAALVHSLWTEPSQEGPAQSYEILWAVKMEAGKGWRVSGMVVETVKGQPTAVDFENGDELAKIMVGGQQPAAQTAAAPTSGTTAPR